MRIPDVASETRITFGGGAGIKFKAGAKASSFVEGRYLSIYSPRSRETVSRASGVHVGDTFLVPKKRATEDRRTGAGPMQIDLSALQLRPRAREIEVECCQGRCQWG